MIPSELRTVAANAERIVTTLATEFPSRHGSNPRILSAASNFIENEFRRLGYEVESLFYESEGERVRNLAVLKRGSEPQLPSIVLGAHYDTVIGTPGADDNASGIAGLIELARLLKDLPTQHTIRFVAFPHEEPPYFFTGAMGSRQYARRMKDEGTGVLVMLALEMLGYAGERHRQIYPVPLMRLVGHYPKYGDYIALVGNVRSLTMMNLFRRAMRNYCRVGVESLTAPGFLPPLFLSDHSSFWKAGFPALMVTDTAFLRNPHYHRASDTPETLNFDFLANVVEGVSAAVLALDLPGSGKSEA